MVKIKVLLIEDNRLLREGTMALLNEQEDIQAVSSPGNKRALDMARTMAPDIVLLDLGLKTQSSLKVLEAIRKQHPRSEIVVMDLLPAYSEAVDLVAAGVSGFVPRNATFDDLLRTIRSVVKGVKILPTTAANSVFSHIVERAVQSGSTQRVLDAVKLTDREHDVVTLLAQNKSAKAIAILLEVTVFTVRVHIRNIMDKLALHTRLELASFTHSKGSNQRQPAKGRKDLH